MKQHKIFEHKINKQEFNISWRIGGYLIRFLFQSSNNNVEGNDFNLNKIKDGIRGGDMKTKCS